MSTSTTTGWKGLCNYCWKKKKKADDHRFPLQPQLLYLIAFLAHLSTSCSRGAFSITRCPSCGLWRQTSTPPKLLGRNNPWVVLFKNCLQNLIPSKTLVAMATKWNFLRNSLKIFPETAGAILK